MTEFFEVLERDGPARLGELRLDDPVTTPACVDDVLEDTGSLWSADRPVPKGRSDRLTVLPHRSMPAGTEEPIRAAFADEPPTIDAPSAVVLDSVNPRPVEADAVILGDAQSIVGHGAAVADALVRVREAVPADTAVIVSGVATPATVPTLVYAGVDLVDETRAVVDGTRGRYLTVDGEANLEDLTELPCSCPACADGLESFTTDDCIEHNRNALQASLATVRERIRAGRLREYLEGQTRHTAWCTATIRTLDDQWEYLEERTPLLRSAELTAATDDTLRRVEVQRFADRVTTRYRPRLEDVPLVLVPCSARKPYSESASHRQFHEAIQWRGHIVSLTSPLGVVPQELEATYPAQHYDAVVTGRWSASEREFVTAVLERYLERSHYPSVVAHVPDGGYRDVVEAALEDRDVPVTYTVEDHPTDEDSLDRLAAALEGVTQYRKREREHATVRALADYWFGEGAGDDLFTTFETRGRYPRLQVRDEDGTQLATMVRRYGSLSLTLAGARRWLESSVPVRRVTIDDFVPHGSVLAPGVVDADPSIRSGDEVVIEGPSALAVGRAVMVGNEMRESTRGVACEVRHVEER